MISRFVRICCLSLLTCSLAGVPSLCQGNGKAKGHQKHDDEDEDRQEGKKARHDFGQHDREIVAAYYTDRGSNLPPGLAKRGGNLPPGLEKQLERNGTLPPGLQKRLQPCPVELERRLPPLEPGYSRAVVGAHLVIYNRRTNVVVDIMKDVVR